MQSFKVSKLDTSYMYVEDHMNKARSHEGFKKEILSALMYTVHIIIQLVK